MKGGEDRAGGVLQRHLPEIARQWIVDEPENSWKAIDASLVFADISGFTALSERLEARGRNGAEELVEVLNAVFSSMLDIAAERGGQLLKFGGDALLLLFDGEYHAHRAAGAAVEMRRALRASAGMQTAVGRLALSMSVGIGTGEVDLFLVGDTHRDLIVLGPATTATIEAEHIANAGEILVTAETARRLPPTATTDHDGTLRRLLWRRDPRPPGGRPAAPAVDAPVLRRLLPSILADAFISGQEPAHRNAAVSFIRFQGTDELIEVGLDAAADALQQTISVVQRALRAENIGILAVDVDADGGKVFCAAGVPNASEDDEGRMLRALRRIAAQPVPLQLQLGVNRGHVFAAEVGSASRATFTAMGDTTNTAARVTVKATPGAVYAHPSVLEHARTRYEVSPVGPFTFKGKAEPLMLYEVGEELGPRHDMGGHASPLFGRDEEFDRLHRAFKSISDGPGRVVTVSGPPGFGKSRLVAELREHMDGVDCLEVRAEPYGAASPYRPFRDPVRALLGVERGHNDAMSAALLAGVARIDDDLLPLAPLLGAVLQVDVPATPQSEAIGSQHRPDRTADLVLRALEAAHDGPLVLIAEDAHWADEASSHLLERIASATADRPWLLVVVRRNGDGFDPQVGDRIELRPLDEAAAGAMIIAATEATPLLPHEVGAVIGRADGNPLFIEELTRSIRAVGSLEGLPNSMSGAILVQVDTLSGTARRVLAHAAVLGRSFRQVVFDAMLERSDVHMDLTTWEELEHYLDDDGAGRLQFDNGLVRDVVYDAMAYRLRARLHGIAGSVIEASSEDPALVSDLLAQHFWEAGDHERTWHYSLIAAERAREVYANVDAALQYERALDAARSLTSIDDVTRADVWTRLGDVRMRSGLLDGALESYRRAGRFVARNDRLTKAQLHLRRARVRDRAAAYSAALGETTRVTRLIDGDDSAPARGLGAEALALAAFVRKDQGHPRVARLLAERAYEQARSVGATMAQARACNAVAQMAMVNGSADAREWWQRALELYEAAGDLDGQADTVNNMGVHAYYEGAWADARANYVRARDAYEKVGNVTSAAASNGNLGELLLSQGRLDEAEPVLEAARRVARAAGFRGLAVYMEMHLGRLAMARGDYGPAEQLLTAARDQFQRSGESFPMFESTLHLADCHTRLGRPDAALHAISEAMAATTDDVSILDPARLRLTAEALASLGRHEDAANAFAEGIRIARARNLEYELALMLAEVDLLGTPVDTGGAEPAAAEAERLFRQMDIIDGAWRAGKT